MDVRTDEYQKLSTGAAEPGATARTERVGERVFEGEAELRPRGVGAQLDLGIDLVKSHFVACFLLGTLLWMPFRVVSIYLAPDPRLLQTGRPGDAFAMLGYVMITNALTIVATSLVTAITARVTFDALRGVDTGVGVALANSFRRLPGLLVLLLLNFVLVVLSMLACILPVFAVVWILQPLMYVYVLEERPVGECLGRSARLTFDSLFSWPSFYGFWRWAGVVVTTSFLLFPLSGVVGVLEEPRLRDVILENLGVSSSSLQVFDLLVGSLFLGAATAVQAGILTAYYVDLRVRRDGLDLRGWIERLRGRQGGASAQRSLPS